MRPSVKARHSGFTVIELVAVIVVIAAISVTVSQRLIPANTYQVQSARDQLITAFVAAQQRAMTRSAVVEISVGASQIDIQEDTDNDGTPDTSILLAGQTYPLTLQASASLSSATFTFDRLGQTSPDTISVTAGSSSVNVTVTSTGYIY